MVEFTYKITKDVSVKKGTRPAHKNICSASRTEREEELFLTSKGRIELPKHHTFSLSVHYKEAGLVDRGYLSADLVRTVPACCLPYSENLTFKAEFVQKQKSLLSSNDDFRINDAEENLYASVNQTEGPEEFKKKWTSSQKFFEVLIGDVPKYTLHERAECEWLLRETTGKVIALAQRNKEGIALTIAENVDITFVLLLFAFRLEMTLCQAEPDAKPTAKNADEKKISTEPQQTINQ